MRVYADSSALIKRSVDEAESDALGDALDEYVDADAAIVSSTLAWVEVSRALRSQLNSRTRTEDVINDAIDVALSGVAQHPITSEVVGLARRVPPHVLRTLDALHLATAILLDADLVLTYDERLASACRHNSLSVRAPGR